MYAVTSNVYTQSARETIQIGKRCVQISLLWAQRIAINEKMENVKNADMSKSFYARGVRVHTHTHMHPSIISAYSLNRSYHGFLAIWIRNTGISHLFDIK